MKNNSTIQNPETMRKEAGRREKTAVLHAFSTGTCFLGALAMIQESSVRRDILDIGDGLTRNSIGALTVSALFVGAGFYHGKASRATSNEAQALRTVAVLTEQGR